MNIVKTLKSSRGDTIIEVLLAITVAAFALGTSYSIANKSLQKSISARERNQAVNILQSQIASLKQRQAKMDTGTFNSNFAVSSTVPANFKHFCLDQSATGPGLANWDIASTMNTGMITSASPLQTTGNPSYNPTYCVKTIDSTNFYIDIVAMATSTSQNSTPPTVYQFNVRWPSVGTGVTNQASVYYRF